MGRVRKPLTEDQRARNREACKRWYRNNKETAQKAYKRYATADWGRYAIYVRQYVGQKPGDANAQ